MKKENILALTLVIVLMTTIALGEAVLTPGDPIIAIDADGITSNSNYPYYEGPANVLDGNPGTKYLNYNGGGNGIMVTPPVPALVQSFTITTANDQESRDPTSWELYGTNDKIIGTGNAENWILLGSGTLELPTERLTLGPVVTLSDIVLDSNSIQGTTPVVVTVSRNEAPNEIPSGAKLGCSLDSSGGSSDTCEVIKWYGYSYWVFSDISNDVRMIIGVYDVSGNLVASWSRSGARYCWQITVDECKKTVTLWGQADDTIVMSWTELLMDPDEVGLPIYSSFLMIFPNTRSSSMMQIADVAFYPLPDGTGQNVLTPSSDIMAIGWDSDTPSTECAPDCIDNNPNTKYLNYGDINSGFIVTPSFGPSILDSFEITTANDWPERDPVVWMVYGTNDEIVTVENGDGTGENWTLICGGTMALPDERYTLGPKCIIANQAEPYTSYKMLFKSVKDAASTNSMQISEIQFYGVKANLPGEIPMESE
jgi:hypothetical protein